LAATRIDARSLIVPAFCLSVCLSATEYVQKRIDQGASPPSGLDIQIQEAAKDGPPSVDEFAVSRQIERQIDIQLQAAAKDGPPSVDEFAVS
jgi:hypothetical protein